MAKTKMRTEKCFCCRHFGYCLIPWGTKCKRQGGKKTPRLKSRSVVEKKKTDKSESRKQKVEIFEPIRTKAVSW